MATLSDTSKDQATFESAISALKGEIANVAAVTIYEPAVRQQYQKAIESYVQELRQRVARGEISWANAAEEANKTRNATMESIRARSTPVGRSIAEFLKSEGKSFDDLLLRYTKKLFGDVEFAALTSAQRDQVYAEVVAAAARSNPRVNFWLTQSSRAGRALIVLSLAISIYTIATADDPWAATKHEAAVTGAGIAGGVVSGAAAGLVCGPGAPICVGIGAFIGGAAAAFGVDWYFWRRTS